MIDRITKFRGRLYSAMRSQEEDVRVNGSNHPGLLEPMQDILRALFKEFEDLNIVDTPVIPMLLTCPSCGLRHHDEGEFATKAHHTHACQGCGMVWRPAKVNTVGVRFLPGYKNTEPS